MLSIKTTYSTSLRDFDAWSGAKCRLEKIIELGKEEELERLVEELLVSEDDDCIDETTLNDFIWFELDNYIEDLGITEEEWNS